jgi:nucleoside-diphosphate-sugar epimerase
MGTKRLLMRVLIAGCGYVGGRLAQDLARVEGHEVWGLSRSGQLPFAGVRALSFDILSGDLSQLPQGLDRLYYCAAPEDSSVEAYRNIYVRGLGRLADFLARTGSPGARLLLTSSTSVYGQCHGELVHEDSALLASSPTAPIIVEGERILGPNDTAVRFGGIYGPGRMSLVRAVRDGTMVVNPSASSYTNRIHRDDAAGILRFAASLPAPLPVINGVDCESATRATVALWLAEALGVKLRTTDAAEESHILRGNKRVSNQRLVDAGYQFIYPSFREGYGKLLSDGLI